MIDERWWFAGKRKHVKQFKPVEQKLRWIRRDREHDEWNYIAGVLFGLSVLAKEFVSKYDKKSLDDIDVLK